MSEQKHIFIRWFSLWVILKVINDDCWINSELEKDRENIYLPYIVERFAGVNRLLLSCAIVILKDCGKRKIAEVNL